MALQVSSHRCECGCGEFTLIARQTKPEHGHVKGQPFRFKGGHQRRLLSAKDYPMVSVRGRTMGAHLVRAVRALGKPLPAHAEVHHADLSKRADAPLVICQDTAYHQLLHIRTRVLRAGGNPNTQRLCQTCGCLKSVAEFVKVKAPCGVRAKCKACCNVQQAAARRRRRDRGAA